MCVRKDLVLLVFDVRYITKELLKDKPFLKGVESCTMIQLSMANGDYYCADKYDDIVQQLKEM